MTANQGQRWKAMEKIKWKIKQCLYRNLKWWHFLKRLFLHIPAPVSNFQTFSLFKFQAVCWCNSSYPTQLHFQKKIFNLFFFSSPRITCKRQPPGHGCSYVLPWSPLGCMKDPLWWCICMCVRVRACACFCMDNIGLPDAALMGLSTVLQGQKQCRVPRKGVFIFQLPLATPGKWATGKTSTAGLYNPPFLLVHFIFQITALTSGFSVVSACKRRRPRGSFNRGSMEKF